MLVFVMINHFLQNCKWHFYKLNLCIFNKNYREKKMGVDKNIHI